MTATEQMQTALYGDPPSPSHKPDRAGVLVAFEGLETAVEGKVDKSSLPVNVKDAPYNAKGDGSTDDTAAFVAAFAYAVAYACDIFVPAGKYIVQPLTLNSTSYAYMPTIYGSGRNSTTLKKKAGSGIGPVLTIGASDATNSMSGIVLRDMTIDGLSTTESSSAIAGYNLVRSHFTGLKLKNADKVLRFYGGVSVRVSDSEISAGNFGVYADSFSGSAGLNWPNGITLEGKTIIQGHTTRGVYFNNGRMLQILDCEIDTCGTAGNNTTSAVYVGPNVDSEDAGVNPIGAIIERCWFEQCAGAASIVFSSGDNTLINSNFGPNPNSVYDVYVSGGTYAMDNCRWTTPIKTPAIYETGANIAGSYVSRCRQLGVNNISVVGAKTQYDFAGRVYTVSTLPSPPSGKMRAWVSDSAAAAPANFGALLMGGGANSVPVFFDGTNWRIG